jgi:hypothetical protein
MRDAAPRSQSLKMKRRIPASPPLPTSIDVRLRFLVERIYRLGPFPLFHLLAELVAGAPPLPRIERYARLSREYGDFIRANGGDQFPGRFFVIDGNKK